MPGPWCINLGKSNCCDYLMLALWGSRMSRTWYLPSRNSHLVGHVEASQYLPTDLRIKSKYSTACKTLCDLVPASSSPHLLPLSPLSSVFHPHCPFCFTYSWLFPTSRTLNVPLPLPRPLFPQMLSIIVPNSAPSERPSLAFQVKAAPLPPVIPYLRALFHFLHRIYYYQRLSCFPVYHLSPPKI